ncbi:MAG: ABC transporter ATP-binding protein [Alphaproteobacteria bacterium]|nr:ABC transporter ATP-binding protein [Alphaproteobacteria bacterium]
MRGVAFSRIAKQFGQFHAILPLDLTVAPGEFVSLLGPSGSGKTTLLNICAGFETPSSGTLALDGTDITSLSPRQRNIGMVFQNYALFPHMSVFENVAYGLCVRGIAEADIARRVETVLATVRLDGFGARRITSLSGGQQQRVALARAIVIEPDILLMDEPLGALDKQLRKDVQIEIRRMHLKQPRTTLYVTHDQEEALVMSDRIAVMRAGRIVQIGTAQNLYSRPVDTFVARFLGESNLIPGRVAATDGKSARFEATGIVGPLTGRATPGIAVGGPAAAMIRPEHVRPTAGGRKAQIVERVFLGEIVALRLDLGDGTELWSRLFSSDAPAGETIEVGWSEDNVSILPETT